MEKKHLSVVINNVHTDVLFTVEKVPVDSRKMVDGKMELKNTVRRLEILIDNGESTLSKITLSMDALNSIFNFKESILKEEVGEDFYDEGF
jgi:hypothetical protein